MEPLKLIVVGPSGTGKSTISNYLADATEIPYECRPTKGVRILEFEVPNVRVKNKTTKVDVELWDCSGDKMYENCWSAVRKDAVGVIFVQALNTEEHARELEKFYDYFVNQPKLEPTSCLLLHYDPEKKNRSSEIAKNPPSSSFARISRVTCNTEEGGAKLKTDFQAFLSTLTTRKQDKSEHEENSIISDSGIFPMRI